MPPKTHFILNHEDVRAIAPPGLLALDYLRARKKLTGTKEGCKEGDCGACVVLVGELQQGKVKYIPVTSCLVPIGELHGKHLVTIEGLNLKKLSIVQQAVVDAGATQCGFCTPGIIVSLVGLLMDEAKPVDDESVKYALSGHLCRCTGYRSLKSCAREMRVAAAGFANENRNQALIDARILPDYFSSIPERLEKITGPEKTNGRFYSGRFIAGGTDIYVQEGESLPEVGVTLLNRTSSMREIAEEDGRIQIGALVTFEEFSEHDLIQQTIPGIKNFMSLNASWQIRNRATLGGNIINASPIGDMTALLLALDTDLVLRNKSGSRTVKMRDFFKGYKILDKAPDEILTEIIFPKYNAKTKINFEKVSKRKFLDIASVNSAISIEVSHGEILDAHISLGGVAPVPLYLQRASALLRGRPLAVETVIEAVQECQKEISPISDVRGSAEYKRLLAQQLIVAHFTTLFPEMISAEDFYETH